MARPVKPRCVSFLPGVTHFKPAGIPLRVLEEVHLTVEEAEAIRLKDLEGLEQEDCARKMNISRPTFHRVLESGRKKIADALLGGKAIRIEGGNFEFAKVFLQCIEGHEWQVPFPETKAESPGLCPQCGNPGIVPFQPAIFSRGGKGMRAGHCGKGADKGGPPEWK